MSNHAAIPALFDAGNYAAVALYGNPDQWQTFAAWGLLGNARKAIEGLKPFRNPEARFYSAVASWIDGDDEAAVHLLTNSQTEHAQNLLSLITKSPIRILSQINADRIPHADILTRGQRSGKFVIQNISFHPQDLPNEPEANIHKFYNPNNPPDFFICNLGPEALAHNLQELPCSILAQTWDPDFDLPRVLPWLQLFDEVLVNDPSEWKMVSPLTSASVSTFPKSIGMGEELLPVWKGLREIDLFCSGTWIQPNHPDKMRIWHQVLPMSGLKILLVDGYLNPQKYTHFLSHSKISFGYNRFSQHLITRGMNSLAFGCITLVQKESMLTLYMGESEGLFTYDVTRHELPTLIQKILNDWPQHEQAAHRGAMVIRREFAMTRVASQYLRFATFLAAKPRSKKRQVRSTEELLPLGAKQGSRFFETELSRKTEARFKAKLEQHESLELILKTANLLALEHEERLKESTNRQQLEQAIALYKKGISRFPKSLVLRFNLVRVLIHLGSPEEGHEGVELARLTLNTPAEFWEIGPQEGIMPHSFHTLLFNWREYMEKLVQHLTMGSLVSEEWIRLVRASLHVYYGLAKHDVESLRKGVTLDSEYAPFSLFLAQALVGRGEPQDVLEAGQLLLSLSESSIFFLEAYELLSHLKQQFLFQHPRLDEVLARVEKSIPNFVYLCEPEFARTPILPIHESQNVTTMTNRGSSASPLVSIVLPAMNHPLMTRLSYLRLLQTISDIKFEIIVVDAPSNEIWLWMMPSLDSRVRIIRDITAYRLVNGYNLGARAAKGKYLVFLSPQWLPTSGWLSPLLNEIESHPDVGIVGSKLVTLEQTVEHAGIAFSRMSNRPLRVYFGAPSTVSAVNHRRELLAVASEGMILSKQLFESVNGFDETYQNGYHDIDLCLKVHSQGYKIVYQPKSTFCTLEDRPVFWNFEEDEKRLQSHWSHKFLHGEDLVYFEDGYRLGEVEYQNGIPISSSISRFSSPEEQERWKWVAALQMNALQSGIKAAVPFLQQADKWPRYLPILEWGARLCEQAGTPEQAEAFFEIAKKA